MTTDQIGITVAAAALAITIVGGLLGVFRKLGGLEVMLARHAADLGHMVRKQEVDGLKELTETKIDGLQDSMAARFNAVDAKIDGLVATLADRLTTTGQQVPPPGKMARSKDLEGLEKLVETRINYLEQLLNAEASTTKEKLADLKSDLQQIKASVARSSTAGAGGTAT